MKININPPINSAVPLYLDPNLLPINTPTNVNKKVIIPIINDERTISISISEKISPQPMHLYLLHF